MTYVITELCIGVKDKACVDECPVDCIYEGEQMLCIRPTSASTAAPASRCAPVEAIFCEDDVPGQWAQFTTENVRFSGQLGSPGGVSETGPLPHDTDYLASYVTGR
jgi:NAD-dependent dihydropyrimidine dehydrogenase PreA subunit